MKNLKFVVAFLSLLLTCEMYGFKLRIENKANYPVTIFCCNKKAPGYSGYAENHSGSRRFLAGGVREFTSEFSGMDDGDDIYCAVMPKFDDNLSFHRLQRYTTGWLGFNVAGTEYLKAQMKNKQGQLYDWVKKIPPVIFEKSGSMKTVTYNQGNKNAQFDNEHLSVR